VLPCKKLINRSLQILLKLDFLNILGIIDPFQNVVEMTLFYLLFYVQDLLGVVVVEDVDHFFSVKKWHLVVELRYHLIMFYFPVAVPHSLLEELSFFIQNLHLFIA